MTSFDVSTNGSATATGTVVAIDVFHGQLEDFDGSVQTSVYSGPFSDGSGSYQVTDPGSPTSHGNWGLGATIPNGTITASGEFWISLDQQGNITGGHSTGTISITIDAYIDDDKCDCPKGDDTDEPVSDPTPPDPKPIPITFVYPPPKGPPDSDLPQPPQPRPRPLPPKLPPHGGPCPLGLGDLPDTEPDIRGHAPILTLWRRFCRFSAWLGWRG